MFDEVLGAPEFAMGLNAAVEATATRSTNTAYLDMLDGSYIFSMRGASLELRMLCYERGECRRQKKIEAEKIFRRRVIVIVMMRWLLCDFEIPDSVMTSAGGLKKRSVSLSSVLPGGSADAFAFCVVFL